MRVEPGNRAAGGGIDRTTAMQALVDDLACGATVVLDGATGTEIERRGAAMHDRAWCAMATLTYPHILREVHEDYIRAGARVITSNTFSTNRNMLDPAGLGEHFEALNRDAVAIACQARANLNAQHVLVAGSMSHQVPITRGTGQRKRRAVPPADVVRRNFAEMASLLADTGVDFILLEMMSDPDLVPHALEAALETGLPVWVGFSVTRGDDGRILSYTRADVTARELFRCIDLEGVGAAGVMHSAADVTGDALAILREHFRGPLMAYPDSGYFEMPNWQFVDIMPPDELVSRCHDWRSAGVQVLGGCCGLGVEHIRALAASL